MALNILFIEGWANDQSSASLVMRYPGLAPLEGQYVISTTGGVLPDKPYLDFSGGLPKIAAEGAVLGEELTVTASSYYSLSWWGRGWSQASSEGPASPALMVGSSTIGLDRAAGGTLRFAGLAPVHELNLGGWHYYEIIVAIGVGSTVSASLYVDYHRVASTEEQPLGGTTARLLFPNMWGDSGATNLNTALDSLVLAQASEEHEFIRPLYVSACEMVPDVPGLSFKGPAGQETGVEQFVQGRDLTDLGSYVEGTGTLTFPLAPRPGQGLATRLDVQASTSEEGEVLYVPFGPTTIEVSGSPRVVTALRSEDTSALDLYTSASLFPRGEYIYEIEEADVHEFVVPDDVYSLSLVAVASGRPGLRTVPLGYVTTGGEGGRLSYSNDIEVEPGTSITISVTNSVSATVSIGSRVFNIVTGAGFQVTNPAGAVRTGSITGSSSTGIGPSGAGGYSGPGGRGGVIPTTGNREAPTPGAGGGGGGGGVLSIFGPSGNAVVGPGGGVGLYGQTNNGTAGVNSSVAAEREGGPGSIPGPDTPPELVKFYGGGLSTSVPVDNPYITSGMNGAVRFMWGGARSFPSNAKWMPSG